MKYIIYVGTKTVGLLPDVIEHHYTHTVNYKLKIAARYGMSDQLELNVVCSQDSGVVLLFCSCVHLQTSSEALGQC